eukprot:TRINITY_DN6774_c0_g4_i1.p1 TRINITY_DN6774_c0_g4~~TRINITY_DN6774_c0_g4_i1.p1  ORF type:complete len:709 (-),score=73.10 TRINITY_DN6774_c0_g4_i1:194-2320(-)
MAKHSHHHHRHSGNGPRGGKGGGSSIHQGGKGSHARHSGNGPRGGKGGGSLMHSGGKASHAGFNRGTNQARKSGNQPQNHQQHHQRANGHSRHDVHHRHGQTGQPTRQKHTSPGVSQQRHAIHPSHAMQPGKGNDKSQNQTRSGKGHRHSNFVPTNSGSTPFAPKQNDLQGRSKPRAPDRSKSFNKGKAAGKAAHKGHPDSLKNRGPDTKKKLKGKGKCKGSIKKQHRDIKKVHQEIVAVSIATSQERKQSRISFGITKHMMRFRLKKKHMGQQTCHDAQSQHASRSNQRVVHGATRTPSSPSAVSFKLRHQQKLSRKKQRCHLRQAQQKLSGAGMIASSSVSGTFVVRTEQLSINSIGQEKRFSTATLASPKNMKRRSAASTSSIFKKVGALRVGLSSRLPGGFLVRHVKKLSLKQSKKLACQQKQRDKARRSAFAASSSTRAGGKTHGQLAGAATSHTFVKPSQVRFSQNSISSNFRDGRSLETTGEAIADGSLQKRSIPLMRVFKTKNGNYFSHDNRRLAMYKQLEARRKLGKSGKVKVQLTDDRVPKWKWSTLNHGVAVRLRQKRQSVSGQAALQGKEPAGNGQTSGKLRTMYHGTSEEAAQRILQEGFRPSTDGMLGSGIYLSRDVQKAQRYGSAILKVDVDLGKVKRIDRQGHPLQKAWAENGSARAHFFTFSAIAHGAEATIAHGALQIVAWYPLAWRRIA